MKTEDQLNVGKLHNWLSELIKEGHATHDTPVHIVEDITRKAPAQFDVDGFDCTDGKYKTVRLWIRWGVNNMLANSDSPNKEDFHLGLAEDWEDTEKMIAEERAEIAYRLG